MKSRPFHGRCGCLFLITVALLIKPERARADRASLRIEVSSHGVATVHFILATLPPKPEALGPLISEALGLKLGETSLEVEEGKKVVTFDASSRNAFPHRLLRVNGKIDLAPLEIFLRDLGIGSMMVEISHPRGAFSYCSPATRNPAANGPIVDYEYVATIASGQSSTLEFGFGYRHGDLLRPVILLSCIGVLLVGATTWRSRATSSRLAAGQPSTFGAGQFHFWQNSVLWIVWALAVYILDADQLARFATGVDSTLSEIGVVTGLLILLPLLVAMSEGTRAYPALTPAEREEESVCKKVWQAIRGQTLLIFSAGLLAAGIVSLRNGATSKAVEWFIAATVGLAVPAVLGSWAKSASPTSGSASPSSNEELIFSRRYKREVIIRVSSALLAAVVLTPVVLVYPIRRLQLDDTTRGAAYLGILIATLGVALLVTNYGVPWGGAELSRRLRGKLKREGTPIDDSDAVFVGLSPGASLRRHDGWYDWDVGWLVFTTGQVNYLGDQTRFALGREQVAAIRLAEPAPGWCQPRRLQVTWKDASDCEERVLSLRPAGGRSLRQTDRGAEELEKKFKSWLAQPSPGADRSQPPMGELSGPLLDEAFGVPVRRRANLQWFVLSVTVAGLMALGICLLLDLPFDMIRGDEGWAVVFLTGSGAAFQMLPYVRHREPAVPR